MSLAPLSAVIEAMARRGEWRALFPDGAMRMLMGHRDADHGPDLPPQTFQFFQAPDLPVTFRPEVDSSARIEPEVITLHAITWSHVTRTVEYGTEERLHARVREELLRRTAAHADALQEGIMAGLPLQVPRPAPKSSPSYQSPSYVPDWKKPEGEE